jgi:hypothetical protein
MKRKALVVNVASSYFGQTLEIAATEPGYVFLLYKTGLEMRFSTWEVQEITEVTP